MNYSAVTAIQIGFVHIMKCYRSPKALENHSWR